MVWVRVKVLGVRQIFFSTSKDDGVVKEVINGLRIEPDDMPLHFVVLWSAALWVIDVGVEFFDQSNVYLLFWEPSEYPVPLPLLELSVKFIKHACGELYVPFQ